MHYGKKWKFVCYDQQFYSVNDNDLINHDVNWSTLSENFSTDFILTKLKLRKMLSSQYTNLNFLFILKIVKGENINDDFKVY